MHDTQACDQRSITPSLTNGLFGQNFKWEFNREITLIYFV